MRDASRQSLPRSVAAGPRLHALLAVLAASAVAAGRVRAENQSAAPLPAGVKAVWDLDKAHCQTTPTRQRICLNGLWRWQPARTLPAIPPDGRWGYFKVPGCWPGITDYMQKDCQTVFAHPSWKGERLAGVAAAWHQREVTVPEGWAGRRIGLSVEYLNSYAAVYVDGKMAGELLFPGGDLDLTQSLAPGKHVLSLLVVAMPLKAVLLSYTDSAAAREVKGSVARRGLCGDAWLVSTPRGARIADVRIDTSVRKGEIALDAALEGLVAGVPYTLRARITEGHRAVAEFTSKPFRKSDAQDGRIALAHKWKPDKLWDLHTPGNTCQLALTLLDADGKALDTAWPERFGFREFWIDGRDFYLNGTRLFLSCVPLDNAQISAGLATYEAAKESLLRLKEFGINFVYTHNYGCEPGSHLGFAEVLRAADDVGMMVSFSQPHFSHYDWKAADADRSNGYARHAEFYVRAAQNHPSVVCYSMSHNATGYSEDMNPDMIDGLRDDRDPWAMNNVKLAQRAEAVVRRLDPGRIVYHHASGNLGPLHASNFYPNFVPIQEMSDWFGHWAAEGVKPVFTCEYGAPFTWDWSMYRGWHKGERSFGSAAVPWEFCFAEWNAQFLGDRAFKLGEPEKANLRWEAKQFRAGRVWHRWDYPYEIGSRAFDDRYDVLAMYLADNWRAFRTWGMSANSPWEHGHYWKPRDGVDKGRKELATDWDALQRPGFSPDYVEGRYERVDLAYERSDWIATPAAEALLRNNRPLLACIAGKPARFTGKDHNYVPGETIEKQIVVINNSRQPVTCECRWSLASVRSGSSSDRRGSPTDRRGSPTPPKPPTEGLLPGSPAGPVQLSVETGQQERIPLSFALPAGLAPGAYELGMTARFSTGEEQKDSFTVHVLPAAPLVKTIARIALFDPKGETARLLDALAVKHQTVAAGADLSGYDVLIVGKAALTADGPGPDLGRVRDGLRVIVFEQTSEALEKRLGFRVVEYGLRNVFRRVPDHPLLAGLGAENLRDWRGDATLLPPRLAYEMRPRHGPTVQWCGIPVTRAWRCGNYGSVASVLIEKPARGDFLPIVDGGFSLQYSPLMACREGRGMVLFCQLDVTGRSEADPAAGRLACNILAYVSAWKPGPNVSSNQEDPVARTWGSFTTPASLLAGEGVRQPGFATRQHRRTDSPAGEPAGVLSNDVFARLATGLVHLPASWQGLDNPVLLQESRPAALYAGDPAGRRHLERSGVRVGAYDGGKLAADQVLIVGPGGGRKLAASAPAIAEWLNAGGRLLAIGLDEQDARAILPFPVTMKRAEHIAAYFGPFAADSPLAGIGPADVHNRGPKEVPLVTGGAEVYGDGVLARARGANVVFFQLAPWEFDYTDQYNLKRTYRRASFTLARLVAAMGAAGPTPLLDRFKTPVPAGPSAGRWLDGLYLDQPEEMDDPYRFFRW